MKSFYNDEAGVVLHSFLESDYDLLKEHKKTAKVKLWVEGTALPDLAFLLECPFIESLDIYGGKIGDYTALHKLSKLKHLFLNGRLRKWVNNFDFVSHIRTLESLGIYNYPMVVQFPFLANCKNLKSVKISGCKRLIDFSNVTSIPNLKSFGIVSTPQTVYDLDCIAKKPGMIKMSGAFGSKKSDDLFKAMLDKYGLIYG